MLSNYLAEIWGIAIVLLSFAFLIKEKHFKSLFASLESDDNIFLWGFVSFIIGLATVLAHNVWVANWRVVVTILGWVSLVKGLILVLFCPIFLRKWAKKIEFSPFIPYALVVILIIGLIIAYFGFTA